MNQGCKDPLGAAAQLKGESEELLRWLGLEGVVAPFGKLVQVGSAAWNLMTWRDIDFQVQLAPGKTPADLLNALFQRYSGLESIRRMNAIWCLGDYKPKLPRGYCFALIVEFPQTRAIWKIDMWVLTAESQAKSDAWEGIMRARLTPEARIAILQMKQRMMVDSRIQQGGSRLLYELVLVERVPEQELPERLRRHGFVVSG